jgi:hypothetical protein
MGPGNTTGPTQQAGLSTKPPVTTRNYVRRSENRGGQPPRGAFEMNQAQMNGSVNGSAKGGSW